MAREQARLSDRRARAAAPKGRTKDGKKRNAVMLADGGNLYLQVTTGDDGNIRRSWIFRYRRPGGPVRDMGLGSLNDVTLAEARETARECRKLLREGIDPIEHRDARIAKNIAASTAVMIFDEAAEIYVRQHRAGWTNASHAREWPSSLKRYASPVIGRLPVDAIETAHISKIIDPIWNTRAATAQRVRGRIESVLGWCTVKGYRKGDNPARWRGHLANTLPAPGKRKVEHLAALPYEEMPAFMAELRGRDGMAARALEFLALTSVRLSDVINARNADIDLGKRIWVIPAFSKTLKEHKVPLSDAAIALIEKARQHARDIGGAAGEYVFVNEFTGQRLSKNTPNNLIARLGRKGQLTPHGFRASFRTWALERTSYPWELAEMTLGHTVGTRVERAYQRGDALVKRIAIMQAWADFLAKPQQPAKVIPLQGRA